MMLVIMIEVKIERKDSDEKIFLKKTCGQRWEVVRHLFSWRGTI